MVNLVSGISETVTGIFHMALSILQSFFSIIASTFHVIFTVISNLWQTSCQFFGSCYAFCSANIIVIGVITLVIILYRDRASRMKSEGKYYD